MTIFKEKQIYGFTVWRWIKGHVFGVRCDSYVRMKYSFGQPIYYPTGRLQCGKLMGHKSRHGDTPGALSWGIGDNLV